VCVCALRESVCHIYRFYTCTNRCVHVCTFSCIFSGTEEFNRGKGVGRGGGGNQIDELVDVDAHFGKKIFFFFMYT